MVNAQDYINQKYRDLTKEKRGWVKKISINNQKLESHLDLGDFVGLEEFYCLNSNLTGLDLSKCKNLQLLEVRNFESKDGFNKLSDINFLSRIPNPEKLKICRLGANNIHSELIPFDRFVNLEVLDLGVYGYSKKFIEENGNKFYGSLKPLQNLVKLKKLDISNTDIDSGLEYLSENVKEIYCETNVQLEFLCRNIQKRLEPYKKGGYYDYQAWRKDNKELVENVKLGSEKLKESIQKSQEEESKLIQQVDKEEKEISKTLFNSKLKEKLSNVQKELSKVREELGKKGVACSSVLYEELKIQKEELNKQLAIQRQEKEELKRQVKFWKDELFKIKDGMDDAKNILLIGHTGSGKSTLGNVLINDDNFEVRDSMMGVTKSIQKEVFEDEVKGVKYRVIDTVGINDNTGLTNEEIMQEISSVAYNMKNGITQILFVTRGRFDQNQIDTYNLIKGTLFDEEVTCYTTIVRTNSISFEDDEWCERERQEIIKSGRELAEVISSCNKFIYVDNGSQENKEKSRKILLNNLANCQKTYWPQSLYELNKRISEPMRKKEELQQKEANLREEIEKTREKVSRGEIKYDEGQKIIELKTEEQKGITVQIHMTNSNINNNTAEHMKEKAEEKGLGQLWLEVIGKSLDETWQVAKEVAKSKCQVM